MKQFLAFVECLFVATIFVALTLSSQAQQNNTQALADNSLNANMHTPVPALIKVTGDLLDSVGGTALNEKLSNERAQAEGADDSLHRCTICGRTDSTAPDLDFRVSKDGHEYCIDHLPKATPTPAQ